MNFKKPTITEHLAFLSVKHGVYLVELFQALVSARETGKSICESLTVEYRGTVDDQAIFLIKKDNNVVVQFRVAEELLLKKDIPFESWMDTDKIRRQMEKQNAPLSLSTLIQDLRHGMKKVNLEAEVLAAPKPSLVHTQYGNSIMLTNALIADETGKIKLCLWDTQVNSVAAGDTIQIKNAKVSTFKGERQLHLGKSGTISVLQSCASKAKQPFEDFSKNMVYA